MLRNVHVKKLAADFSNTEDIRYLRNRFVAQVTNCLWFFHKLKYNVKLKLFNSYCSSMYGCELWSLSNKSIDEFALSCRRAVRRVLCLPPRTHSHLLPLLNEFPPTAHLTHQQL